MVMFIFIVGVFPNFFILLLTKQSLFLNFAVLEVQQEGKYAIDSPGNPTAPVIPPEEYELGR